MINFHLKSLIIIISITILFLVIYYVQLNGNYIEYIRKNWKKFQCKPYIIPFAGFFRPKNSNKTFYQFTFENFKKCQWVQVKIFFGFFIKPITYIIKIIAKIIKKFTDTLDIFRKEAKSMRLMFKTIVESIAEKMENSYAAVQFYQAKMQNIIKHQIVLFQLLMYFIDSLKLTMESLINGPLIDLVKFLPIYGIALLVLIVICLLCIFGGLFTKMVACPICLICFKGDTQCIMKDGEIKCIKNIILGEKIDKGDTVTSTYIFDVKNKKTNMYNYNGIIVSGSHIVYENDIGTRVENSVQSKEIEYLEDRIYCLNTKNRYINIVSGKNKYIFSDFFECSNDRINFYHQKIIEYTLNNKSINNISINNIKNNYYNYEWGFDENTLVKLSNGRDKKIKDIELGNELYLGGKVYGKVQHLSIYCEMYQYQDIICSGTQLVKKDNKWYRIYNIPSAIKLEHYSKKTIYHIVCDKHFFLINKHIETRDYLELPEDHPIFDIILNNNINEINKDKLA